MKTPHLLIAKKTWQGISACAASLAVAAVFLLAPSCDKPEDLSDMTLEQITDYWHSGKTLPIEVGRQYPPLEIKVRDDKGYNVMIDISHQVSFASLWGLGGRLHDMGFRSVTNQASLDTVLDPAGKCRIRIPVDPGQKIFPFAWYPNFQYNVVVTEQGDPEGQHYTDEEQAALVKFVEGGGGLVIMGSPVNDDGKMQAWSLNSLARRFGGELQSDMDIYRDRRYAVLKLSDEWEVIVNGKDGKPIQAKRDYGKGRVILAGSQDAFRRQNKKDDLNKDIDSDINAMLDWLCETQEPVGGEPRFPQPMGGGGAIYPELEGGAGDIVVYYAKNQKEKLLKTVRETFPEVTEKVLGWLPSRATSEPMYLILSAGDGGGWAVNAFQPKENGVISDSPAGLISIYAHEFAHTIGGPDNDQGFKAGEPPIPNQGEAHAGWFQGKADAWFDKEKQDKPNRNCNSAFESPRFLEFDLKKYQTDEDMKMKFSNGDEWNKIWYIWQKFDDRYGTTWYPRWKWIQHTRWAAEKNRRLTWEEMAEDMSLATGEDLFPFFRAIGTSLDRETVGELEFQGKKYQLKPSGLEVTPAGPVRLESIGDYKKEIVVP